MQQSILKTIKRIGFIPFLCKLYNRIFLRDQNILTLCDRNGAYDYLMFTHKVPQLNFTSLIPSPKDKTIWTCWLQGEENAPKIVQVALQSMRKWAQDYQVVVITYDNISQYIDMPQWLETKRQKGIIPIAHYTDIVRLMLLKQYGGIWLDSTIYLTDYLPRYLTDSPIFCYKTLPIGHEIMGNSIIASDKNNPIISTMLQYLLNYWEKENKLISYSLFHIAWDIVVHSSTQLATLWEQIPYATFHTQWILRQEFNLPFTEHRYIDICNMTSLHKFTYKFDTYHIDTTKKGTFYDVLINQNTSPC